MKRAAVLALLVTASAVLAPVAQAATKTAIAKCTDGDFHGEFKLTYTTADLHRLMKGRGGAGPYIGDSGAMNVRVYYQENGATNTALNRTKSGLRSDEIGEVPVAGTRVPRVGRVWLEVKFSDSSGLRCTGRKNLT